MKRTIWMLGVAATLVGAGCSGQGGDANNGAETGAAGDAGTFDTSAMAPTTGGGEADTPGGLGTTDTMNMGTDTMIGDTMIGDTMMMGDTMNMETDSARTGSGAGNAVDPTTTPPQP